MNGRSTVRFLVLIFVSVLFFLVRYLGLSSLFTFDMIQHHKEYLMWFVTNRYWLSVGVYLGVGIVGVTFLLPVTAFMTLVAGFLFGIFPGLLYANISATVGSTFAFLIVRYTGGNFLQEKYAKNLVRFNENVQLYGTWYLLLVHLIAVIPFAAVNVCAGLTRVSLWTFLWTTIIGIIPSQLVYTFAGQRLATVTSMQDVFSPSVIGACIALGAMGVLGVLVLRIYQAEKSK